MAQRNALLLEPVAQDLVFRVLHVDSLDVLPLVVRLLDQSLELVELLLGEAHRFEVLLDSRYVAAVLHLLLLLRRRLTQ